MAKKKMDSVLSRYREVSPRAVLLTSLSVIVIVMAASGMQRREGKRCSVRLPRGSTEGFFRKQGSSPEEMWGFLR